MAARLEKWVAAAGRRRDRVRSSRDEEPPEQVRAIQRSVGRQVEDRSKIVLHSVEADLASEPRPVVRRSRRG